MQINYAEMLAHPLTLLLVGAILSSYLIPSFTRQWQDRQRELDLKIALVNEIDQAVTTMIMAVQYAVLGSSSLTNAQYDEAYRTWNINYQLIRSKLKAYFPHRPFSDQWEQLGQCMDQFYAGSGHSDPQARQAYSEQWLQLRDDLFARKNDMTCTMLVTPMPVFR